jgi:MYXO-CTERM domain-containing protein
MARRSAPPPQTIEPREFRSADEIDAAIRKLDRRLKEFENLDVRAAYQSDDGSDDVATMGCEDDSDCGNETSGKVCNDEGTCQDGCRGEDGNGCPAGKECTSQDAEIGECILIGCLTDADCGTAESGRVCDVDECIDGCRGNGGNSCAEGFECTSDDTSIGECIEESDLDYVAQGTGFCNCVVPGQTSSDGRMALLGLLGLSAMVARRRKR